MRGSATAFAPSTCANLGPGYDLLGLALDGPGDTVRVELEPSPSPRVIMEDVTSDDVDAPLPPCSPNNSAAVAALETLRRARCDATARVWLHKGLSVGTGLGSSAASAAAGAYAANLAMGAPFGKSGLIGPCIEAEALVSGRHADNVAPALLGGLVLVRSVDPVDVVRVPVPASLRVAIVSPRVQVLTRESREVVPASVSLGDAIEQAANLGSFVAACHAGDLDLLGRCIHDRFAEPHRLSLIPGAAEALAAMRASGALGASISGSGPTLFALTRSDESAQAACDAARTVFTRAGIETFSFVSRADAPGVREVSS